MNTKEKIAVMTAFMDGLPVEVASRLSRDPDWLILQRGEEPSWNWVTLHYRIKPREPQVVFIRGSHEKILSFVGYAYTSKEAALQQYQALPIRKFIEVIE